jgi:GDP/UDP-N,N'-diacetylbacillosamine 2-epimerase (hydrolysing)
MHLSPTFGHTYKEIEADGFQIDHMVEILSDSDTPLGISESISKGIQGCALAFDKSQPDLIVLLGDRFEAFAAATAALVGRIPVAHIHGGESTEGLIDEAFRHSITKMSHLHFVAAPEYRDRVLQLGENSNNVYLVGGLGLDKIRYLTLLDRETLEEVLGLKFNRRNLLVTFHPVTLERETAELQMSELLQALSKLKETTLIFTLPNADTGGRVIIKMIEEFVQHNLNAYSYKSLGDIRYLSCLQFVDGVVGNSSSGLTEVPSFKKATVNIGDRQLGRLKAKSVIDCLPTALEIELALDRLYSISFQQGLQNVINPYGSIGAGQKILQVIKSVDLSDLIKKKFNRVVST